MSKDLAILSSHLSTLLEARSVSQQERDPFVAYAIQETRDDRSLDTRRAQWEYLLKNEVFKLAATEGEALKESEIRYFDELKSRLDLVLAFTEHDMCDSSFPFSVLEDLLEGQTIESCWHIFSWIEERTERLTTNMIPAKGKSLVLLRTLNDLLRRLSKTGKNTMFCGRILNFFSSVFSLGERSGVNLRGDYGPQWEGDVLPKKAKQKENVKEKEKEKEKEGSQDVVVEGQENDQKAKRAASEEAKKEEFYQTFWWLQLPYSRPPLFAHSISVDEFKDAVNTVLLVISEATKKERAMMGSKSVSGALKRKRDMEVGDDASRDYVFAKFLTSPELLDLEIADTLFRRQFLFQLLILLQHLQYFTPTEVVKWATTRNRSLHMDFTLTPADAKWVEETWIRALEEMRPTSPNGKVVGETLGAVLERERNWIRWKNDLCPPFDKEPLQPSLEEQTRVKRQKLMEPPPPWRYRFGSEALTELWETGFHGLSDCTDPPSPDEVKDFAKRIKQVEMRINMRKAQLEKMKPPVPVLVATPAPIPTAEAAKDKAAPTGSQEPAAAAPAQVSVQVVAAPTLAAPVPSVPSLHPSLPPRPVLSPAPKGRPPPSSLQPSPQPTASLPSTQPLPSSQPAVAKAVPLPPLKVDPQLMNFNLQRDRLSWLAIRRARAEHLHLFGKIGVGDVDILAKSIDQEREKEKEREKKEKDEGMVVDSEDKGGSASAAITLDGGEKKPLCDSIEHQGNMSIDSLMAAGSGPSQDALEVSQI
ncbi:THO complex subunit 1 transcription elongation factor-domain-containing protein [Hysterangium stoloniferum]|nr:THO complex subunit 1 transcription elongation factor-domain-containing protein [Hysterangium stoloniferum]KAF8505121.1 THO complex subunit 1 transcription elongation factor-domain-containing protein [Hysterangium stoloniferum]